MKRWLADLAPLLAFVFLGSTASYSADPAPPKKADLYFFVIDKSESIKDNKLVDPIRKAFVDYVDTLPSESEVQVMFFNDRATDPQKWLLGDRDSKQSLYKFFDKNFTPSGKTRLYDTVTEVVNLARMSEQSYRVISIMILSDGEDTDSRKYKDWTEVEKLAGKLKQSHSDTFFHWITVGDPDLFKNKPSPTGVIKVVSSPSDIEFPVSAAFRAPAEALTGKPAMFDPLNLAGVTKCEWDFGDGSKSADPKPEHSYAAEGPYTVKFTVWGKKVATDTQTRQIVVAKVIPLKAMFKWPSKPTVGVPVEIQDMSTGQDPDQNEWNIASIGTRKERQPTVTFAEPGSYRVTLTVKRGQEKSTIDHDIAVLPPPPPAAFTVTPTTRKKGETIVLRAERTQANWVHSFTIGGDVTLDGPEVRWKADKEGEVGILHQVEGPGGVSQSRDKIFVETLTIGAAFKWTPAEAHVGVPVDMQDMSTGHEPDRNEWNISSVGTRKERQPTVTFAEPGSYRVTLTVKRGQEKSTIEHDIVVLPQPPPAAFTVTPSTRKKGDTLVLRAEKTQTNWVHSFTIGGNVTLNGPEVRWKADREGEVGIVHQVEGPGGVSKTKDKIFIDGIVVSADFTVSTKKARVPFEVKFTHEAAPNTESGWQWDFGDGETSNLQSPTHEYTRVGTYRPRLTVTDSKQQTVMSSGDVVIQATGPLAWYWKTLIGLVIALLVWLLVVVPVAKVFILPHQGSRLFTTGPNRLREKALANSSIWWPVGYVRIGATAGDNIKIMITDAALQNKSLAVVERIPFTKQYTLRAKQSAGVQVQAGSGTTATRKDVKTCQLKSGTVFFVANTQFRFELG